MVYFVAFSVNAKFKNADEVCGVKQTSLSSTGKTFNRHRNTTAYQVNA